MVKFIKKAAKEVIGSNRGISIILAIIIIIVLGLAGSIFAYLMSSGNITSRSNLTGAEAKYAAKSGVEITMYEIEYGNSGDFSSSPPPPGCPTFPIIPPFMSGTLGSSSYYLSGNLQGNLSLSYNYTPTFCAVYGSWSGNINGCNSYIVTSNGFAGGTEREITAEIVIKGGGNSACPTSDKTGIYVETELPNSYQNG